MAKARNAAEQRTSRSWRVSIPKNIHLYLIGPDSAVDERKRSGICSVQPHSKGDSKVRDDSGWVAECIEAAHPRPRMLH